MYVLLALFLVVQLNVYYMFSLYYLNLLFSCLFFAAAFPLPPSFIWDSFFWPSYRLTGSPFSYIYPAVKSIQRVLNFKNFCLVLFLITDINFYKPTLEHLNLAYKFLKVSLIFSIFFLSLLYSKYYFHFLQFICSLFRI